MKPMLLIAGLALMLAGGRPALAYYHCEDGQMPAPPELAAQMALPACGFAATKRWGPNGCQLCDARNMHPNPFSDYHRDSHRSHRYHVHQ